MKIRFLLALVGLAIGLAVPTFAQQKDTIDPQIRQQIEMARKAYDDAFNKNDLTAMAALYTQDAVQVGPQGTLVGKDAILKGYRDLFNNMHPTDHVNTIERVFMLGQDVCVIMNWSATLHGTSGSIPIKGYVTTINVREGDNWPVHVSTYNITPPPAATSPWARSSGSRLHGLMLNPFICRQR
jgi:uncharacterized protein (TIGR02246 family)